MLTVKHNTIVPKYIFYSKPSAHHTTRPCQSKRRKRVKPSVNCVMVALCCFTDARLLWQNVKISLPWQHGSFGVQSEWYHYITQPQTRNLPAQISGNFSTDNPHNNPSSVPTISPSELENEHWISVQVQIGDPIRGATWRVFKNITGLFRHCWYCGKGRLSDLDSWKTVHSLSKSHPGTAHLWDVHQGMETV